MNQSRYQKGSVILFIIIVLVGFSSVGCGRGFSTHMVRPATNGTIGPNYILGPEDLLLVSVWGEEALTKQVTVRPDGKISLPLIPDLQASGLTPLELRDQIAKRLQGYVKAPNVSVVVLEANNFRIFLLGEIAKPGMYRVRNQTTLLQAISMAGGFTHFAAPNGTTIIRHQSNSREVIPVQVNDIVKNGLAERDLWLMPGDIVIIP